MVTPDDLTQISADLIAVRDVNPTSIVLRRGDTTLPAQTVRIAPRSSAQARTERGTLTRQAEQGVTILGSTSLDIAVGDRFTTGGVLYIVVFVRVGLDVAKQAEADAIE